MVNDDAHRLTDQLLDERLWDLQRATELPVVFGGLTESRPDGQRVVLSSLIGTRSSSLHGLVVSAGRGLGGIAIIRGRPFRVADYASNQAITHDYDRAVVRDEQLKSIFAFPVMVAGRARGVLYGAVREGRPIDNGTLHVARLVTARLERDLRRDPAPVRRRPAADGARRLSLRERTALHDLAAIVRRIDDPSLREQLVRIYHELNGPEELTVAPRPTAGLAPREIDVLQLVAIGASNVEAAGQLGLSAETVKAYLRSAMRKLGVHNRSAAVHAARTAGAI